MKQRRGQCLSRRELLRVLGGALGLGASAFTSAPSEMRSDEPHFVTRGVVLTPDDLALQDWPRRAKDARLTTIALHHGRSPSEVVRCIQSPPGLAFLSRCRQFGLQVEYELHAMSELLPRELFAKDPSLFRMNEKGERTPDANLCVSSARALEVVAENAVELCKSLRPATRRYFLWGDDGQPGCKCRDCSGLSDSDQALVVENRLLEVLRKEDPRARIAHLAYARTLRPPKQVRPKPGVFLEFAPINRRYDIPLATDGDPTQRKHLEALDANLEVFGAEGAQALEYWLDVSRFSHWTKPAQKLPFDANVFASDLDVYGRRGIRHITSFAVFMDADYVARYGEPPLREYGQALALWRPR